MATQNDELDFSQPNNELTQIANARRSVLLPRNDFQPEGQEYGVSHPDATADGDNAGRGTGQFLDIFNYNAGTLQDIQERIGDIKVNKYNNNKPYYVQDDQNPNTPNNPLPVL